MMMRLRCEGRQLTVAVMLSLEEEERQQKATADEHTAVNKWPQCTRAQIQKYTSTKCTNPLMHLTKFDQYKVQVLHKANDGHKRHKKHEELTGAQAL